jgi:hypothetical protein
MQVSVPLYGEITTITWHSTRHRNHGRYGRAVPSRKDLNFSKTAINSTAVAVKVTGGSLNLAGRAAPRRFGYEACRQAKNSISADLGIPGQKKQSMLCEYILFHFFPFPTVRAKIGN